jgi:hypothetical protein
MARQELVRKWSNSGFTLRLWDTYRTDRYGKSILAYEFKDGRKVIFSGEDYHCAPSHAIDSDACVADLLSFLSLRPGDTDPEYFDGYTPEQTAWMESRAEELSFVAMEMEESAHDA